jgi:hypothetical protein
MVISEPSRLTRRTLLTGAAAFAAGTALSSPTPAHRPEGQPHPGEGVRVHAAAAGWTGRNGELLVLTAEADDDYALRLLEAADPTAAAELGPRLPLPLPTGFHPHSMAALNTVLWITGAVETAPDQARPALVRIENGTAAYAAIPIPPAIRSGIATAITPIGAHGLAVAIEGGPDPHLAVISRSHLATTADGGRTWTDRPLAAGLGEGYGTVLTATAHGLFAAVADGSGAQAVHVGPGREPVATVPAAGRPMAAIAAADHVSVYSDRDGTVTETRFTSAGAALESVRDCGCRGEILAVPGRLGLRLEIDGANVHIRE